jgi:ATP-binding protein involved in chromosome partitioning
MMMGVKKQPEMVDNRLIPLENYGVKIMSMGFLVDENSPVIWRGPMFHGIIRQFMEQVAWEELDYLIIDLPPGTGDAQLSVCQLLPVTGAIIVTTPQDVALGDAKKGLAMFQKVNVPVLGIVENMSTFACPHCGQTTEIFSHGGGKTASEKLGVPFLGEIPLVVDIRIGGDEGNPITVLDPDSPAAVAFRQVTGAVADKISTMNALNRMKIPILGQA